ncbi:hypothetical protein R3I93_003609 [Phoxinus phoxinus]|uniref:Uncharacterized protein n=1 Tax=Phoxinus phoxinus TaxID=58324 RepID=A0AAN9DID2_9TELE
MTCFLTCMFTLLQIFLVPSKAMLFPPENLTVGLLDFKATAEWLPGQGNPPGTKYTLEFITAKKMSTGNWIRSPHCTNITILKCELTFDPQPDELFRNYFVRVKTTFRGTSSQWRKTSKSFQPYGDTRLSSPNVTISTDQKSINIAFSHWLESKPWIRPLKFLLYLCWESPTVESKCVVPISTSKSPYIFPDVASGKNYCVSVSASHRPVSKNNNFNTTKCIFLDSSRSSVLMVCIAAIVLITFSTGIVVIFGCFYDTRLIIRKLSIPDALIIFPGNNCVLKLIPEEFQKTIQTWQKPLTYKEDGVSVSEQDSEDSQFYHQRENLLEQAEEAETSNQCYKYTAATYLELNEESGISEKDDNDDDMHPVTPASLFTCTSESSKFLQATTVNTFVNSEMDRYCAEETPCSSGNDCENEVPAEQKEEEDDVSLLAYYSSENGYEYEPRHDIHY